jgi:hypothetical protein
MGGTGRDITMGTRTAHADGTLLPPMLRSPVQPGTTMPTGSGRRVWPALLLTLALLPIPALAGASARAATSGSPQEPPF